MNNAIFRQIGSIVVSVVTVTGVSILLLNYNYQTVNLADCLMANTETLSQAIIDREAKCLSTSALRGKTPLQAAEAIRTLLTDPGVDVKGCHLLGHAVGKAMYRAIGDAAIIPGQSWCNDSYYHGLMAEQIQKTPGTASALTDSICSILTAPGALRALDTEQCRSSIAHGTGHAVYANSNSIARSFSMCNTLENDQQEQCAYGAVMEHIMQSDSEETLKDLVQVSICATQANKKISAGCYSGLAEISVYSGVSLTELCAIAELWAKQKCEYSYGSYLTVIMNNDRKNQYVNQITQCGTSQDCSRGMGAMSFLWNNKLSKAIKYCKSSLTPNENQLFCLKGAQLASEGKSGLENN